MVWRREILWGSNVNLAKKLVFRPRVILERGSPAKGAATLSHALIPATIPITLS